MLQPAKMHGMFCVLLKYPPPYFACILTAAERVQKIIFNVGLFYFSLSFLIGNLARSGGNGVGAAAVQQMEATMGGRDTTDGKEHHRY